MKKTLAILFSFALTGTIIHISGCQGKGPVLVKVGGSTIAESDLESLVRVNPRLKPRLATPAGKQKILENFVEQELLYQESLKRGLNRSKEVKEKTALYDKIIIAQALLDDELDKKVKEYYENHKDEFERIRISHILVRVAAPSAEAGKGKKTVKTVSKRPETEALKIAEQTKARLAKGEDFGKVAQEISEDDKTKETQGDLGYVTIRDRRLERLGWLPLSEKAFAMKVGEISDAVKTKEGFHIVKLTEEKKAQTLDEAEAAIQFRLQSDIRTGLLEGLKKKYKIEYAKGETSPETAPSPASAEPAAPESQAPAPAAPQ